MYGKNGWYTSSVIVKITPGTDVGSGVKGIRYKVTGANEIQKVDINTQNEHGVVINKNGTSTITAYTIDRQGNVSSKVTRTIKKDSTKPEDVTLEIRREN